MKLQTSNSNIAATLQKYCNDIDHQGMHNVAVNAVTGKWYAQARREDE